jgi:hypothetical protein
VYPEDYCLNEWDLGYDEWNFRILPEKTRSSSAAENKDIHLLLRNLAC